MCGAGYRLSEIFAFASGSPAPDGFGCENRERDPDGAERNQVRARERFVKEENAEKKTDARREILEEAECRQPKMTGGVTKPDQRQTGHDACADQEQNHPPTGGIQRRDAAALKEHEVTESNRSE